MPVVANRTVRWLAAALLAWTLAGAAYSVVVLTFDRAPAIHVRWAPAVDDATRAELQNTFALTGGQYDSGRTWVYFLTSPSAGNIEALVKSPAVDDTHHIDRLQFRLSPTAQRSGPYISTDSVPRWVPGALQVLAVLLAVGGALALGVAGAPTVARLSVGIFSQKTVEQLVGQLRRPATWAFLVTCGGLVLIWTRYVGHLHEGAEQSLPFRVGDWLVSYEVGFVRRGLFGSPLLALTGWLDLSPETIVLWMQIALYTAFSLLLVLVARRKRLDIWFLAFLFSPAALLFPLYDPAVTGRKDVLFFVVFALYAWWMPRAERRSTHLLAAALGAATTLTHELFFFFTPYFFLMRLLQTKAAVMPRHFVSELSLFGGSLVALLLSSTAGADLHGEAQCAVLLRRGFNEQLCDGLLRYPITTIRDSMGIVEGAVRNFGYLRVYAIAGMLAVLPLAPLLGSMGSVRRRQLLLGTGAAFAFTLPMFAIALDWGRLLNIHVTALAVVILAFVLNDRQTPEPVFGVRSWWLRMAIVVGVLVYLTTWSIRHCCTDALAAGLFA